MNLLFQVMSFLARSAFKLSLRLLGALVRFVLPLLVTTLRLLYTLAFTSLTASVQGPGQFTNLLASEWTRRLLELGVPREHFDQLYSLCRFFAASTILLGWLVTALFNVVVFRVVFGFFIR